MHRLLLMRLFVRCFLAEGRPFHPAQPASPVSLSAPCTGIQQVHLEYAEGEYTRSQIHTHKVVSQPPGTDMDCRPQDSAPYPEPRQPWAATTAAPASPGELGSYDAYGPGGAGVGAQRQRPGAVLVPSPVVFVTPTPIEMQPWVGQRS